MMLATPHPQLATTSRNPTDFPMPGVLDGGKFRVRKRRVALWISFFILAAMVVLGAGCGFHYYDAKTGVEHVWGFGHLRMRVLPPTNGVQAVIKGYSIVGAKVGGSPDDYGFSLGYDSWRMIYLSPLEAQFALQWPDAGFFNVRIGTNLPPDFNAPSPKQTTGKP